MHECDTICNESFENIGEYIYNNDNNVALLFMGKKKSGFPGNSSILVFQPLIPARTKAILSISSVVRLFLP